MRNKPLFITGIARGGTNLIGRLLDAHPEITIAIDPYFPLFRSLRNAIIFSRIQNTPSSTFKANLPFQDYYFSNERLQWMNAIQASQLHLAYNRSEDCQLHEMLVNRTHFECPDLIPYLRYLSGDTYQDLFDGGLKAIIEARDARTSQWIGLKEVWIIEFFTILARAYPEAKFIIIIRDPRAVAASILGFRNIDPSQVAHTLSFLRHWRKSVAFAWYYQTQSAIADRFYVTTYEQLVKTPEKTARDLCDFLNLDYDRRILDTERYFDFARGKVWQGNSTFVEKIAGIDSEGAERWRNKLDPIVTRVVEFICGAEMKKLGYNLEVLGEDSWPDSSILEYFISNNFQECSWRSDFGDLQQDYGFELFRRSLLDLPEVPQDRSLIRRSFLFEAVYRKLRE
ncbi:MULTISPECIES: sulfotransferase [Spirulina sp. CCY15215]|uniref:sulfotransferase n=1 Tax=Spirulina sp. CCY15215 TaxID=2767591 RepID=UPI001952912C